MYTCTLLCYNFNSFYPPSKNKGLHKFLNNPKKTSKIRIKQPVSTSTQLYDKNSLRKRVVVRELTNI